MIPKSVDRHEELEHHRRRLSEVYKPQTSRELMIIDELAQVYQEKAEFERDHKIWMQHEANTALQTIRRQEADDFLKLLRQWPKAPAAIAPIVGQSINGALWLMEFWQLLVVRLAPKSVGPVPGMDQACQALMAMGFAYKIQNLSEIGWWWATRFLAIQPDKDLAIAAWLRKSGTCDRAAETQQARHKLYDAPDATAARIQLYDEAVRQAAFWSHQLKQLKEAEPAMRQAQMARARCMGLKTPGLATCLNNAFRLRVSFDRSIKFAEERLTRVRKERARDERYEKRMVKMQKDLPELFPNWPEAAPNQAPVARPIVPGPRLISDQDQLLEDSMVTELLPRMAAATAPVPQPHMRPMSNRKKRLAKMAAKQEKARAAGVAMT